MSTSLQISSSDKESQRFGLTMGRLLIPSGASEAAVLEPLRSEHDFDVVVVRHDAGDRDLPAALARLDRYRLIPADHLMYSSWSAKRFDGVPELPDVSIRHSDDPALVESLFREIFDSYSNHYTVNPLLDRAAAHEGYIEWALDLVAAGGLVSLVEVAGEPAAAAILDWTTETPDIKIGGVRPGFTGRGLYAPMIAELMRASLEAGHPGIVISTQSDNISVQRWWCRLGLLPTHAVATHHLVRRELLTSG